VKIARFAVDGILHEGMVREDGNLVAAGGAVYAPEQVVWLPPVVPSKVLGLALNFADHAAELDMQTPPEPALFFKPNSALIGHRAPIVYPTGVEYMHYEVELAVVIGKRCRNVPADRAGEVIAGYTIANDVTIRDFVRDFYRPPVRAKGYDTFGPVGPYLVSPDEFPDVNDVELRANPFDS
jgi:5-oxopent-3-ene-1,2,5-tricarboxylate decarboxylase/2-hydroxyhepta-2,4-diene-1,7-dioate isomerase